MTISKKNSQHERINLRMPFSAPDHQGKLGNILLTKHTSIWLIFPIFHWKLVEGEMLRAFSEGGGAGMVYKTPPPPLPVRAMAFFFYFMKTPPPPQPMTFLFQDDQ